MIYRTWKFPTRVIPKQAREMATRLPMFSQGLCTLGFSWRYLRTPRMKPKRDIEGGRNRMEEVRRANLRYGCSKSITLFPLYLL